MRCNVCTPCTPQFHMNIWFWLPFFLLAIPAVLLLWMFSPAEDEYLRCKACIVCLYGVRCVYVRIINKQPQLHTSYKRIQILFYLPLSLFVVMFENSIWILSWRETEPFLSVFVKLRVYSRRFKRNKGGFSYNTQHTHVRATYVIYCGVWTTHVSGQNLPWKWRAPTTIQSQSKNIIDMLPSLLPRVCYWVCFSTWKLNRP